MKKTLSFELIYNVPSKIIYNALIDPMEIMKYTRAPCKVEPVEKGNFTIFEGKIIGKFLQLVIHQINFKQILKKQNELIKMEWKFNDWESNSIVEITFQERDEDCCKVEINQTQIPSSIEVAKLEDGWKKMIFIPMSQICGYSLEDE